MATTGQAQYSVSDSPKSLVLGLRSSELLALKVNDIDFKASTVRVDESSDQRSNGKIGPCKNAPAYRTVVLLDSQGKAAMKQLRTVPQKTYQPGSLSLVRKAVGHYSKLRY